jgi:hypothetical protein
MAFGVLGEIVAGLAGALDLVDDGEARSSRFLLVGWIAVAIVGAALWRWMPPLLDRVGGWAALAAVGWALVALYMLVTTVTSVAAAIGRRASKSRPAG